MDFDKIKAVPAKGPLTDPERAWLRIMEKSLNRRVEVEEFLLDCAHGKRSLPTADECLALSLKLGVPET